jgi:hypothetical protein
MHCSNPETESTGTRSYQAQFMIGTRHAVIPSHNIIFVCQSQNLKVIKPFETVIYHLCAKARTLGLSILFSQTSYPDNTLGNSIREDSTGNL